MIYLVRMHKYNFSAPRNFLKKAVIAAVVTALLAALVL